MQPELLEALAGEVALLIKAALGPVLERLAVAEARLVQTLAYDQALTELRDRVLIAETKTLPPDLSPDARVAAIDTRLMPVLERLAAVSERVAVVETRAPVPGPAGQDGAHGKDGADGLNGKDGADGLGFDDLAVAFDGDRTVDLTFVRGTERKSFPIVLPFLRYVGVYQDGKAYTAGDVVTWAGSTWTAAEATTTKPGDGSKSWQLCVKRGRDGKDGVDAPGALPVVKVR
jgi:hypothetical protein